MQVSGSSNNNRMSQKYGLHIYLHRIRRIHFYCCLWKTCSLAQASQRLAGTESYENKFKVHRG